MCVNGVDFGAERPVRWNGPTEKIVVYSSFGLSTLSTIGFMVMLCNSPPMKYLPVKMIANLVGTLCLAQSIYISSFGTSDDGLFCKIAGIISHYFWLSTYTWSVICAHYIRTVFTSINGKKFTTPREYLIYITFGYFVPLIVVAVFVAGENFNCFPFEIIYGEGVCFLNSGKFYGLDAPIISMIIANFTYFALIVFSIKYKAVGSIPKLSGTNTFSFLLYVKVSTIMGLSWTFGMLAQWTNLYSLWIVSILLNGLQGTALFFTFVCSRGTLSKNSKAPRGAQTQKTMKNTRQEIANS